jgi:hypothetical protein
MYEDSWPYKEDLKRSLTRTNGRIADFEPARTEAACLAFEKFVFWSAFVVRKLADSNKLSDEIEESRWSVERSPKRDSRPFVDFLNRHRLEDNYDLANTSAARLETRRLCGILLHSLVFLPVVGDDERSIVGFFFNSDKTKDNVYLMLWEEYSRLVRDVSRDDVVAARYNRLTGKQIKIGPRAAAELDDVSSALRAFEPAQTP